MMLLIGSHLIKCGYNVLFLQSNISMVKWISFVDLKMKHVVIAKLCIQMIYGYSLINIIKDKAASLKGEASRRISRTTTTATISATFGIFS